MIREHLIKAHPARDESFRWRGDGVSRIEGLSDAVFGFGLALLVASLGVPRTYADLVKMLASFPAFTVAFLVLIGIWSAQYKFFRRYGLEDARTIKLNVVLLLFVVFYVYPLMFVFNTVVALWLWPIGGALHIGPIMAQAKEARDALQPNQWPGVMVVFGAGYLAVSAVFALLHRHALHCGDQLELDALERLETRYAIREHLMNGGVAVFSATITLVLAYVVHWPPEAAGFVGGISYMLTGPAMSLHHRGRRRARAELAARGAGRANDGGQEAVRTTFASVD